MYVPSTDVMVEDNGAFYATSSKDIELLKNHQNSKPGQMEAPGITVQEDLIQVNASQEIGNIPRYFQIKLWYKLLIVCIKHLVKFTNLKKIGMPARFDLKS